MTIVRGLQSNQRAALIISETQRNMTDPTISNNKGLSTAVRDRGVIPNIVALAQVCRETGVPVFHCPVVYRADFKGFSNCSVLMAQMYKSRALCEGEPGAEWDPGIPQLPQDVVMRRQHGLTAFHDTGLESMLRSLRVETIILTGVSTNIGLPGIATEAVNRGLNVVIPEDCTAGGTPETHQMQITMHLPLLAAITDAATVMDVLKARARE